MTKRDPKPRGAEKIAPNAEAKKRSSSTFSAATFFDVVDSLDTSKVASSGAVLKRPVTVAFYGFRGGAGRTMALAHAAVSLTRRGLGVAAIDLDLESPGLHRVLGVTPSARHGSLFLLRDAFYAPSSSLDVAPHVQRIPDVDDLWVIPAGALDAAYLATLEELNIPSWHLRPDRHPIQTLISGLEQAVPKLDVVLLDCRTGLHPSAATAVFHVADVVVLCSGISSQVWDGIEVFLDALKAARSRRDGLPLLLLLRGMVPPGELGDRLALEFRDRFLELYCQRFQLTNTDQQEDPARPSWELEPLRYDIDLASRGVVELRRTAVFERFSGLVDGIAQSIGAERQSSDAAVVLNRDAVLRELEIPKSTAFAEEISSESIEQLFVKSVRHNRIEDAHTTLVIGAKGAGKSLFWRWLLKRPVSGRAFVAGHAPRRASAEGGPLMLTPDSLKELERDAEMKKHGTHKAFWALYALACVAHREPLARSVVDRFMGRERQLLDRLVKTTNAKELAAALLSILRLKNAGTLAEEALAATDGLLGESGRPQITLVYDGLDDGFDVGRAAEELQQRYVNALLQLLGDVRGRHAWISLKVFLREDIWESSVLQNRSHLDAGRVDLKWEPSDLWQMALRLLRTSKTYERSVAIPPTEVVDIDELEAALEPLWGRYTGGHQTARTANYVKNRMADGLGRFFPRTLVQMLESAVVEERSRAEPPAGGRVLHLRSIQAGIEAASGARVKDLRSEYAFLGPYLDLFDHAQPTGSRDEVRNRLSNTYNSRIRRSKSKRGVQPGLLHAGPGGWMNVVQFLEAVGVLGERVGGKDKLQVALLYRPGLGIPSYGG